MSATSFAAVWDQTLQDVKARIGEEFTAEAYYQPEYVSVVDGEEVTVPPQIGALVGLHTYTRAVVSSFMVEQMVDAHSSIIMHETRHMFLELARYYRDLAEKIEEVMIDGR